MKYMVLAGVIYFFVLCAGICGAQDLKDESVSGTSAVTQGQEDESVSGTSAVMQEAPGDEEADAGVVHLDRVYDDDQDVAQVGVMSPGQSYDENTGFPDVVPSDSNMEL